MGLIKIAKEQHGGGGIAGWAKRHPLLTAGIGLTGGIAASDVAVDLAEHHFGDGIKAGIASLKNKGMRQVLKESAPVAKKGLAMGTLYGATLAAVEPAIEYGALRKKD